MIQIFKKFNNFFLSLISIKSDFQKLFFKKEYLSLTEEFGINFYTIFIILLLTFSAFSFSIGSLDYLRIRMKDPFTNWVDVPVTPQVKPKVEDIVTYFNQDSIKHKIYLDNISKYSMFWEEIYDIELKDIYQLKGRTISDSSSLLTKIIEEDNIVFQNVDDISTEFDNCGVLINDAILPTIWKNKKNYPKNLFIKMDDGIISLPVLAVVKDLPDNAEFIFSNRLYNITHNAYLSGMIVRNESNNIFKLITSEKIHKTLIDKFRDSGFAIENIKLDEDKFEYEKKIIYTFVLSEPYPWELIVKSIDKYFKGKVEGFGIYLDNECPEYYSSVLESPHKLAFNFNDLSEVRKFNKLMNDQFDVEVNMAQIVSKENFSLVSKLTFILSLILFLFSLISIIFFINSVLTKHLQKIKANLGTMKAFGIGNSTLNNIYMKIIFTFILFAGLLAYCGNILISQIINLIVQTSLLKFYSIYIILIFILILTLSLWYSRFSIMKVLKNTPGNLIYNRK